MNKVVKDMVVSFRYVMSDSKGNVLEDTTSLAPTRYLHGSSGISALLQDQLEGMLEGETRNIALLQSSGQTGGDYYFQVFVDAARPAEEKELVLGYPLDVDEICDEDCECYKE